MGGRSEEATGKKRREEGQNEHKNWTERKTTT
jgi:hypothetical protein